MKKTASIIYTALTIGLTMGAMTGCDSDADIYKVGGLEGSELLSTGTELTLLADNSAQTAVSFVWANQSELKIYGSDRVGIADRSMPVYALEFSLTSDFEKTVTESVDNGIATYTVQSLNTIVVSLGAKIGEMTPVYVRVNTSLGENVDGVSSNVVILNVSTYKVDYTYAKILNADMEDTEMRLISVDSDGDGDPDTEGVYEGFVGATAWQNWYLSENDGTVWGNDGDDGTPFLLASNSSKWNFWYPGVTGCYYVNVNTNEKEWTAVLIGSLTMTGDIEGELSYVRSENRWMTVITTEADNQTFTVSGTGKAYNIETGTDDTAAKDYAISFGPTGESGALEFGGEERFSIAKAGTYTLSLYLSDFAGLSYALTSGAEEIEATAPSALYMQGVNDIWDFTTYVLPIADEDNWIYKGVAGVASCPWGLRFNTEADNWDEAYRAGETEGTLSLAGESNITFDGTGVYLWTIDLKNLTYTATPITEVYYTGFNDNWDMTAMTPETDKPTTYTAEVTITKASEWGAQILLDSEWTNKLGGADGKLQWSTAGNITDDATLEAGTYTLTVDFAAMTYSLTSGDETGGDGTEEAESEYPTSLYAVGMSDWTTFVELTGTSGVYSGSITITDASFNSLNFEVYDTADWSGTKYGPADNDGNMTSGTSAWKFWVSGVGTYTLTIDLTTNKYTISEQ